MGRTFYQGNPVNCILTATPTLSTMRSRKQIGFHLLYVAHIILLILFLSSHINHAEIGFTWKTPRGNILGGNP